MVNYKVEQQQIHVDENDKDLIKQIKKIRQSGGNFQTIRKSVSDEKLIGLIKNLYPRYDITTLEKLIGIPDSSLAYWFKQLKINTVRRHVTNSSIPANFDGSIVLASKKGAENISAIKIDKHLAYFIGFNIGDGSTEKYSAEVFNKDPGMKDDLEKVMTRFSRVGKTNRDYGLWKLRLSSVKISDLIKRNKSVRQETVEYILEDQILANYFLAGLWDAEGTVRRERNYYHIYLYNSNKELIDRVSEHLKSNDMPISLLRMKKRENPYYLRGRKIVAKKTVFRIAIRKTGFKIWANTIGLHLKHSKKSVMAKELLEDENK